MNIEEVNTAHNMCRANVLICFIVDFAIFILLPSVGVIITMLGVVVTTVVVTVSIVPIIISILCHPSTTGNTLGPKAKIRVLIFYDNPYTPLYSI